MGRLAATLNIEEVHDRQQLATLMVGKDVELLTKKPPMKLGTNRLQVKDLCCNNEQKFPVLKNISFTLRDGEILGICGVDGNGQSELIKCITGLHPASSGSIRINDSEVNGFTPKNILKLGVSHIPEDRHKYGMVAKMSIEENLILMSYQQPGFSKKGFLRWKGIAKYSKRICDQFNVKTQSIKEKAGNLSGGNQQKFVVGRELDRNPSLLIAVHPSRGLDIGATKYIQSQIVSQRARGAAILMVSTELDELMELSDRILVMYEGQVTGIIDQKDASREVLGPLMAGIV
jgi:simple sugar transport system ATP-binding protein